jgi:Holliday junction resolvase RusA-like endonuclease
MLHLTPGQARKMGIKNKPRQPKIKYTQATWEVVKIPGCIKLTIPENMPSLNEWKLWHPMKQNIHKQLLTRDLKILFVKAGVATLERARIQVVHYHHSNRRRDEDNYAPKFLLDALRYAGFIAEDNSEVLQLMEPEFRIDKEAWRTEVFIYG